MSLREDREEEYKNEALREAAEWKKVCFDCGRQGGQHEMNCPNNEDEDLFGDNEEDDEEDDDENHWDNVLPITRDEDE